MTKDIEREAFEEFYKTQILTKDYEIEMIDQLTEFHVETGLYEYARMQTAWQSWQAAKAHEAEKLKGKVVVPVEPTQAMIDAVRSEHEGEPYLPYSLYKSFLKAATVEAARGGNE